MTTALSLTPPQSRPRLRFRAVPATVAAVLVAALSLIPIGFIAYVAVSSGWDTVSELVLRPKVGELLLNTVLLQVIALPIGVAVSVAAAILTERTDLPGARFWAWIMVAPLAVPAFVHSYAWNSLFPQVHGLGGAVLISVLAYFPFIYLPVAAQLRRLDPALEDTAASLGLSPAAILWRVVVPQLRLAVCGGALLFGLHMLAEYGLFVLIRYDTFATAIVDQFQSVYNGPAANLLGGVLVLLCLLMLNLESLARGNARYARVGSGAARRPADLALRGLKLPALILPALLGVLALGVPAVTLTRWLISGGAEVWRWNFIGPALSQTLVLALLGAALTTLAAIPIAWLSVRAPGRLQRAIEACHYYTGALPGVIIALALVTLTVRMPIYQTIATLLFAYVLMFLPRAVVGLRASIAQSPVELERAALSLGRPPLRAIATTTLRLAAPGAAASAALVALGIANELTGTLMLSPNGTRTLATRFWAYTAELDFASAAPYAVFLVILSAPLVILLRLRAERISAP